MKGIGAKWSASATDRVLACPASLALPHVYSPSGPAAERGTAIHAYLRDLAVEGREIALSRVSKTAPWRALCEALDLSGLLGDELAHMHAEVTFAYDPTEGTARLVGTDLGRDYADIKPHEISGTADLVLKGVKSLKVLDYKSGQAPAAATSGQLALLALMAARALGHDEVTVSMVRVDEEGVLHEDCHELTKSELEGFAKRVGSAYRAIMVARGHVAQGRTPNVTEGSHCRWCPALRACPAHTALVRELAGLEDKVAAIADQDLKAAWDVLRKAKLVIQTIEGGIKARAEQQAISLGEGRYLTTVQQTRETIPADKAWPVLTKQLGHDGAMLALRGASITKTALANAAGSAPVTQQVLTELRKTGAIDFTSYSRLTEKTK